MAASRGSAGSASATRRKTASASRMSYYGEESSMIELSPVCTMLNYFVADVLSVKGQGCVLVVVDRILLLWTGGILCNTDGYVYRWMVMIIIIIMLCTTVSFRFNTTLFCLLHSLLYMYTTVCYCVEQK